MYALTKKDVRFIWTPECQQAFDRLKELLQTTPVLDFSRPFILETDASGAGLDAVLALERSDGSVHPVAYAIVAHYSNTSKITESLSCLGVVWAVKNFRPYRYGHYCTVYTDHEALKSLLNTPQPSGKLARWGMALQELDFTIVHRSGSNADAHLAVHFPTLQMSTPLQKW